MDAVTICNLALARLGVARIVSFDEASDAARYGKLFYLPTLREELDAFPWNFATARVALSELSTAPAFGWAHQYGLPADFLTIQQLNGWQSYEQPDNWEIEGNLLLTNAEIAQVKYTRLVEDVTIFDSNFVQALSIKLAMKLARSLTGSETMGGGFMQEYERLLKPLAQRGNASEARPDRKLLWVESDLVRSRFGGV